MSPRGAGRARDPDRDPGLRRARDSGRARVRVALRALALAALTAARLAAAIEVEESPGAVIPDNNPTGVTRNLNVPAFTVRGMSVLVDITHSFRSDLIVELRSPRGTTVALQRDRSGTVFAPNINDTYPDTEVPDGSLDVFDGEPAAGVWSLVVRDVFASDVGTIDRWRLRFDDPLPAQTTTFSGVARYNDQEVLSGGLGTPTARPIRFADVQVFRQSDQEVLARVDTDATGAFSATIPMAGTQDLGVRVFARQASPTRLVSVKDNITDRAIYSLVLTGTYDTDAPVTQDILAGDALAGGIFNIFDVTMTGLDELDRLTGVPPPRLTVYWEPGSTDGTFYRSVADSIHLLGTAADSDEFDDDVILHEVGHFGHSTYSNSESPGGSHSPAQSAQDLRLAFGEGFANYFSAAVRVDPELRDIGAAGVSSFELDGPSFPSAASGQDSENTVGAVMWDLIDGAATPGNGGGDDDPVDLPDGPDRVFKVMQNRIGPGDDTILETFLTGWPAEHGADFFAFELRQMHEGFGVDIDRDRLVTAAPNRLIQDNQEVVEFLAMPQDVRVEAVNVFVDLDHPRPEDLVITLVSPLGKAVVLYNRGAAPGILPSRGARSGIYDWFQANEQAPFQSLGVYVGDPSVGSWQLRAQDAAAGQTGTLNRVFLDIRGKRIGFPDLEPGAVSGPGAAVVGGAITAAVTVRNTGDSPAAASAARLVLSADQTITAADTTVATFAVPGLVAGGDFTTNVAGAVPAVSPGRYFLGVIADDAEAVAEGDETNNALPAAAPVEVTAAQGGVDLAVQAVTAPAAGVSPGSLAVSAVVVNSGSDPAPATRLAYRLSTDAVIDAGDLLLEEVPIAAVAGASSVTDTRTVAVPAGLTPGTYFVGAVADSAGEVTETDEANNAAAAPTPTALGESVPGVDLVAVALAGPPAASVATPFGVSLTVRNGGDSASPGFDVSVFLNTGAAGGDPVDFAGFVMSQLANTSDRTDPVPVNDRTFSFSEDPNAFNALFGLPGGEGLLLGTVTLPSLGPGESRVENLTVTIPGGQPGGAYLLIASVDPQDRVAETDETNNVVTSGAAVDVGAALLPDLTPTQLLVPGVAVPGGELVVTRTLTNLGGVGTAIGFTEEYFLTEAAAIQPGDPSLGAFPVGPVGAGLGDVQTRTLLLPPATPLTTTGRVAVRLDTGDAIFELSEDNNELVASTSLVVTAPTNLPDLVAARVATRDLAPGQALVAGQGFAVDVRIENAGLTPAPASRARLVVSSDAALAVPPDVVFHEFDVPTLAPVSSLSRTLAVTLPLDLDPGEYFLGLEVDTESSLLELSEANNAVVSGPPLVVSSNVLGIDLLISVLDTPFVATEGTSMTFDVLVVNRGIEDLDTPFVTQFFLSDDPVFDAGDTPLLPPVVSPGMVALGQQALRPRVEMPVVPGVGPFFLIGVTDQTGAVAESDETNNVFGQPQPFFTTGAAPELRLTDLEVETPVVAQGGRFFFDTFFENVGTAPTGVGFDVAYSITEDALDPGEPRTTLAVFAETPLEVAETRIRRRDPVDVPMTLDPGRYDVCVELDPANAVPEAFGFAEGTAPNGFCLLGLRVTLGSQPPDYVPTAVAAPFLAFQNQALRIDRRVENRGNTAATVASTLGYYLSTDSVITTSDLLLATEVIEPLSSGANDQGSFPVIIPGGTAPGTYFVGVVTDIFDEIGDGVPANNGAAASRPTTIGGSPDLVVAALAAPPTAFTGQDLMVERTIENIGLGDEIGAFVTRYFLSADPTFDEEDFFLGLDASVSLSAGATEPATNFFELPVHLAPGTYFLGAEVDATDLSAESEEANNFLTAPATVTLAGAPDLVAVSVSSVTSGTTGTPIEVTGRIRNAGNLPTLTPFQADFYLTPDGLFNPTDPAIGTVLVNQLLDPADEVVVTSTFAVPATTPGTYTVYMELDGPGVVAEADESTASNNALEPTTVAVVSPDAVPPQPRVRYLNSATGLPYPDSDFIPESVLFIEVDFGEPVRGPPLAAVEVFDGPDLPATVMSRVDPAGVIWRLSVPVRPHDGGADVDGGRTLTVSGASDLAGNPALPVLASEAFFSVDTRPPAIDPGALTPPDGGTHGAGVIAVAGATADPSPVAIAVAVDGGPFTPRVPEGPAGAFSFAVAPVVNPTSTYQVLVTDRAGNAAVSGLRTVHADADGDGLPDFWELGFTGGLTSLATGLDFDGDGLLDQDEFANGTDPTNPDTDGDGVSDGVEVAQGSDPVNAGNLVPVAVVAPGAAGPPRRVVLDGSASSDGNGDPLTYEWTQVSGPPVALDSASGAVVSGLFLTAGTYQHQLVVRDGRAASAPATVVTQVRNLAPEAKVRYQQVMRAGTSQRLVGGGSRDPNADLVNHNWTEDPGNPLPGLLSGAFTPSVTMTAPVSGEGTYRFVDVTDDGVTPTATPANLSVVVLSPGVTPPAADAGPDLVGAVGVPVSLVGSGSRDPEQVFAALNFAWSLDPANPPGAALAFPAGPDRPTLTAAQPGVYRAFLTVTAAGLTSPRDEVWVEVRGGAGVPVARPGGPYTVAQNAVAALDAGASLGVGLAFSWRQVSGVPVELNGAATATPTFVATHAGDARFELTVTQGGVRSRPAIALVRVTDPTNAVPRAAARFVNLGPPSINGRVDLGGPVLLDAGASFDDGPLSFSWRQLQGPWVELRDAGGPTPTVLAPGPGGYVFEVTASDGFHADTAKVAFAVDGPNEPPIVVQPPDQVATVGAVARVDASGTLDRDGGLVEFFWTQTAGVPVAFSGQGTAAISFIPASTGVYEFTLRVFDGTDWGVPADVRVTVQAAGTPPPGGGGGGGGGGVPLPTVPPIGPLGPGVTAAEGGGGGCEAGGGAGTTGPFFLLWLGLAWRRRERRGRGPGSGPT